MLIHHHVPILFDAFEAVPGCQWSAFRSEFPTLGHTMVHGVFPDGIKAVFYVAEADSLEDVATKAIEAADAWIMGTLR